MEKPKPKTKIIIGSGYFFNREDYIKLYEFENQKRMEFEKKFGLTSKREGKIP